MGSVMQLVVFHSLFDVQEVETTLITAEHVFLLQTHKHSGFCIRVRPLHARISFNISVLLILLHCGAVCTACVGLCDWCVLRVWDSV